MLMPEQVAEFYPDLNDPDMESALALVPFAVQHQYVSIVGSGRTRTA